MIQGSGSIMGVSEYKREEMVIRTHSPEETVQLGRALGKGITGGADDIDMRGKGLVVALTGEMGAGKTKMTQGMAKGLGIDEGYKIVSPSFTLINEYPGKVALYHIDLYRLSGADELLELGYEEYFYGDGVTVVEWAERADGLLPNDRLHISISIMGESDREFNVTFLEDAINRRGIVDMLMNFVESQRGS